MKTLRNLLCVAVAVHFAAALACAGEAPKPGAEKPKPAQKPAELPTELNPRYYLELANVHLRYGQNDKAIELFTKAVEVSPDQKVDPGVAYGLGRAYMAAKDFDKAEGAFSLPIETMEPAQRVSYLVSVAKMYKQAELYEKAEKMLQRAQKDATAEREQGLVLAELLELYKGTPLGRKATAEYERRIAENPKDSEAIKSLMDLYLYDLKLDDAAKMAARFAELNPDNIAALRELSFFYLSAGDIDKTIEVCQKLIEKDPANKDDNYTKIIYLYTEQNKLDQVEIWADKAAKDDVKSGATYAALAHAYLKAKQTDKALGCYKKAVEVSPEDLHTRYAYGILLAETGKTEEAKKVLEPIAKAEDLRLKAQAQQALLSLYKGEPVKRQEPAPPPVQPKESTGKKEK